MTKADWLRSEIKKWFEINYLDGDEVQDGQMLASSECLDALVNSRVDFLRSEIEKLEGNEDMLVKHLVDRFLGWHLPKDFHPDGGISFDREYNVSYNAHQGLPPSIHEPTGTNLFTAEQAKEMFRFLLENEYGTSVLTTIITWYKEELKVLESK